MLKVYNAEEESLYAESPENVTRAFTKLENMYTEFFNISQIPYDYAYEIVGRSDHEPFSFAGKLTTHFET